jgi:hypothetical protein
MMKSFEFLGAWTLKRLRALLAVGVMLAALPAASLAAEDSPLCSAGATWVDMDDPERHPAALDRAALGSYDADGDAQTCVRPVTDEREGNLRIAYKVADLGEAKAAGAAADCPDDSGPVDMHKPASMPFPLTPEDLTFYDRNGDGQLCVSRPQRASEGDAVIDMSVVEPHTVTFWCRGQLATIIGTPQDDSLTGTPGDDVIVGLGGDDEIYGNGGNDIICGNEGIDEIFSGDDASLLYGGPNGDKLYSWGTDRVYGNDGDDYLYGWGKPLLLLLDGGPDHDYLKAPKAATTTTHAQSTRPRCTAARARTG